MGRIGLAISVFFRILFDAGVAAQVRQAVSGSSPAPIAAEKAPQKPKGQAQQPRGPARSEALTLLATLQREARLVDFVQEPVDAYSDAQVGAAVREIHRQCAAVFARLFELRPVVEQEEGSEVNLPPNFEAARYRLTGKVAGEPPYRGRLVHPGWEASKCDLPTWSGTPESARVVVPAEVEIQ